MEARTGGLPGPIPQDRQTGQGYASGWCEWVQELTVCPELTGLIEGCRIPKPEEVDLSVHICSGFQAKLLALPGNTQVIAVGAGGCCAWATEYDGLTTLESRDPVDAPASHDLITDLSDVGQVLLVGAKRKLIGAAYVEYVADIEVGWTPVKARARTGNKWCSKTFVRTAVEQVARIRKRLGVGIGEEIGQAVGELLFQLGLQAVVDAASDISLIASALREIRKRDKRSRARVGRYKLRNSIVTNAVLKITPIGEYVCRLCRDCVGKRILESEVCT